MPQAPTTETLTKTFTVTSTKLLVATAALAAASGLALMAAPPTDFNNYDYYQADESTTATESTAAGEQNAASTEEAGNNEAGNNNENPCETTNAEGPGAPLVFADQDTTKLQLQVTPSPNAFSPNSTPDQTCWTRYAIREETTRQFVQANGSLLASPDPLIPYGAAVYQTAEEWGLATIKDLDPSTKYTFIVDAKNKNNTHSGWGPETSRFTAANPPKRLSFPLPPTTSTITFSVIPFTTNGNSAEARYAIKFEFGNNYDDYGMVQANGSLAKIPEYRTATEWGDFTVHGLKPSTDYRISASVINGDNLFGGWGTETELTTLAGPCTTVTDYNSKQPLTVNGAPVFALDPNFKGGPASPSASQVILKFSISALAGPNCKAIELMGAPAGVSSTFGYGWWVIYKGDLQHLVGQGKEFDNRFAGFLKQLTLMPGDTANFILTMDTSKAQATSSLSVGLGPYAYWKVSGEPTVYQANPGNLPSPWVTFNY